MTRRAGLPRFSALSVRRGDAGHREACATPSESFGKPPLRSRMRPVGGRRKVLTMHRIACNFPPTRRAAYAISMDHDQRSLVFGTGSHGRTARVEASGLYQLKCTPTIASPVSSAGGEAQAMAAHRKAFPTSRGATGGCPPDTVCGGRPRDPRGDGKSDPKDGVARLPDVVVGVQFS